MTCSLEKDVLAAFAGVAKETESKKVAQSSGLDLAPAYRFKVARRDSEKLLLVAQKDQEFLHARTDLTRDPLLAAMNLTADYV